MCKKNKTLSIRQDLEQGKNSKGSALTMEKNIKGVTERICKQPGIQFIVHPKMIKHRFRTVQKSAISID